jgi:hypothetical protein
MEYLKHGSTSRGSSFSGRPFSSMVLPCLCSASSDSLLPGSAAMKAGTSIITLFVGSAFSRSFSRLSLATLSETRAPSAGHTLPTAFSSCAASRVASGLSGNTVSRVAVTERLRSMNGE